MNPAIANSVALTMRAFNIMRLYLGLFERSSAMNVSRKYSMKRMRYSPLMRVSFAVISLDPLSREIVAMAQKARNGAHKIDFGQDRSMRVLCMSQVPPSAATIMSLGSRPFPGPMCRRVSSPSTAKPSIVRSPMRKSFFMVL